MISYISGRIIKLASDHIIVENGGIGYNIFVPTNSSFYICSEGDEVKVFTHVIFKQEDEAQIFGFDDSSGLEFFKQLIAVTGVGPKAALSVLGIADIVSIKKAIAYEDVAVIKRAVGIGKKIAERIILEIKDKVDISEFMYENEADEYSQTGKIRQDRNDKDSPLRHAQEALVSLGFSMTEAMEKISAFENSLKSNREDENFSVEDVIRFALSK